MEINHIYWSVISNLFLICYVVCLGYFLSKEEPIDYSFMFYIGFLLVVMDVCFFTIFQLDLGLFMSIFGLFLFLISVGYASYDILEKKPPNVLVILSLFYASFLTIKSVLFQIEHEHNRETEDVEYEDLGPV